MRLSASSRFSASSISKIHLHFFFHRFPGDIDTFEAHATPLESGIISPWLPKEFWLIGYYLIYNKNCPRSREKQKTKKRLSLKTSYSLSWDQNQKERPGTQATWIRYLPFSLFKVSQVWTPLGAFPVRESEKEWNPSSSLSLPTERKHGHTKGTKRNRWLDIAVMEKDQKGKKRP